MVTDKEETMIVAEAQAKTMLHRIVSNIESIRNCDGDTKKRLAEFVEEELKNWDVDGMNLLNAYLEFIKDIVDSVVLGQLVRLKKETMGNKPGTLGVCFEAYHLDKPGAQVIFPNGEYCGFSLEEQAEYFELGQVLSDYCNYVFRNVMTTCRDFQERIFKRAFETEFEPATPEV